MTTLAEILDQYHQNGYDVDMMEVNFPIYNQSKATPATEAEKKNQAISMSQKYGNSTRLKLRQKLHSQRKQHSSTT